MRAQHAAGGGAQRRGPGNNAAMATPSPHARAGARLMKQHHRRIAQAVVRQQQRMVPRYRQLDATAVERNVATVLAGLQRLLESGEDALLKDLVTEMARLRQLGGVTLPEFLVAALCVLPVLRRFFLERSATLEEGLAIFDRVEAILLPVAGTITRAFDEGAVESWEQLSADVVGWGVERVIGDDCLES